MNTQVVAINKVKSNPSNPRIIRDDKFKKLVQSIIDFPQMLEIRPIVVDADMIVLGGNMRLKAAQEAGLKKIPIIIADELTEEQKKEFIIKDNVGFGEWDWELLANEWDNELLVDWGLDVWIDTDEKTLDEQETSEPTNVIVEFNSYELAEKFYDDCLNKNLKVKYK